MKKQVRPALLLLLFLVAPVRADGIVVEELVRATSSWDGTELPAYPAGQPEITVLHITIPPGAELEAHKHSAINAGVLLSGALTVVKEGGETRELQAGDALVELVETWHYGRNDGDEPAVVIVFYAGTQGETFTQPKAGHH